MSPPDSLSAQLRALRTARGLTQMEVARVLDTSQRTISAWENGWLRLTADQLATLAALYEVPLETLQAAPVPKASGGRLTRQQLSALKLVAQGLSNAQIAERMGIRLQRVKSLLWEANRRLGSKNRTGAVRMAIEQGWLTLD